MPTTDVRGRRDSTSLLHSLIGPALRRSRAAVELSSIPSIDALRVTRSEPVSFCTYCGRPAAAADVRTRICARCELGLILLTERGLAPTPGDAFLITDADLLICAVSDGAERLLGSEEPTIIHHQLSELLVGVDHDERGKDRLPDLLRAAAAGPAGVTETFVKLLAGTGEQYPARLGACGPPSAALLVIGGAVPLTGAMG